MCALSTHFEISSNDTHESMSGTLGECMLVNVPSERSLLRTSQTIDSEPVL